MDLREKLIKYFEEQTSNTRGGDIVIYLSTMEDCKEMADEVIELVKTLNIDDVSNCLHENQVMRQGDGDVYHQCLDCCELLE